MKKLQYIILLFLFSFSFTAYAQLNEENSNTGILINESTSTDLGSGETLIDTSLDTDITYTYYYGQGCSYCAKLDRYINSVDGYNKLNIEKKEIFYDDDNREAMLKDAERLGLNPSEIGVPFFIVNKGDESIPLIGDKPVIEYLSPILGEAPENKNKTIILAILGVLAVILPVFLIRLSSKN